MNDEKDTQFLTALWKRIEAFFHRWQWRVFGFFYVLLGAFFYVWVFRGTDFPNAEKVLLWAAPLLVAFALRILVDTHLQFLAFTQPNTVTQKECVHRLLERLRRTATWKHTASKPITIDVLGVSLHHSHEWIENEFKAFMEELPAVCVDLRLAFVDPDVLKKFAFDNEPVDWADESRQRVEWVRNKLWRFAIRSKGRLRLHVRTIQNLPHWHGILVERRYLFLGRVSWTDGTERIHERPLRLTCAHNGYRCFAVDDRHYGDDRVSLFRRWMAHYLYGNHEGTTIIDTISDPPIHPTEVGPMA